MAASARHICNSRCWLLTVIVVVVALTLTPHSGHASQDVLPHLCDSVKCPPMSAITCPEDSDIRESIQPLSPLLASSSTAAPLEEFVAGASNTTEIPEELYAHCCLATKCLCRTCYIPECPGEKDVVVEIVPESMDMPGQCCGEYECHKEPNCTEVRDTDSYWLTDCQRCKCYSGERICHQSCDEGMKKPSVTCNSKSLNTFFEHGASWKDGCYECECVNGEEKCVMPFCRSVNCPLHRQVMIKDHCCPVCWPKGFRMPNDNNNQVYDDDEEDEEDDDLGESGGNRIFDEELDDNDEQDQNALKPLPHANDDYAENDLETLPNIKFDEPENYNDTTSTSEQVASSTIKFATTTATSTTTTATPTTAVPSTTPSPTTTTTSAAGSSTPADIFTTATTSPCLLDAAREAGPATYQVYPEVVEVVRQTRQNDLLYAVIGCLALVVVLLAAWNIHLRAKQRSYRPVSHIDDTSSKMSSHIKKMNDYV